MRFIASLLVLALGLAACGGGWDPAYGCEQTIACAKSRGQTPPSQSACEATAQALYDALSDDQKDVADKAFSDCKSKTGCDFEACIMVQ